MARATCGAGARKAGAAAADCGAGRSHIFVVAATGGAAHQVSDGPYSETGPLSWSPDGAQLLLASNREKDWERDPMVASGSHSRHRNIYRVNVADGSFAPITHRRGSLQSPAISPDGRHIAYLGFDDQGLGYQHAHLSITNRDGSGEHTIDAAVGRAIESYSWGADGRHLYIAYTDRGIGKVAQLSLDGAVKPVADHLSGSDIDLPYSDGSFSVAANGTVAYLGGAGDQPSDLYVVRQSKATRLTHFNAELLQKVELGTLASLTARSSFDQRPIDAWVLRPPGFSPSRKYPLILEIHGGPYASYGPVFSVDDQLFAAAGYVVVYANPRGSTSYGEEFANLIQYHFPEHDYDDLMSVVEKLLDTAAADLERRRRRNTGRRHRTGQSLRDRRIRWRRADGMDCRRHPALSRRRVARAGGRLVELGPELRRLCLRGQSVVPETAVGRSRDLLVAVAAVAGGQGQDADADGGGRPGFAHHGWTGGRVLPGSAAPQRADGARQDSRRCPRADAPVADRR